MANWKTDEKTKDDVALESIISGDSYLKCQFRLFWF